MSECFGVLLKAFFASDPMGKTIVILLVCASVYSLSICGIKFLALQKMRSGCRRFIRKYKSAKSPLSMCMALVEDEEMPLDCVCRAGYEALSSVMELTGGREAVDMLQRRSMLQRALTQAELDKIRTSMVRQMNIQQNLMSESMGLLGTIVQLAPFMGLLGTVWGVMMVFFEMGTAKGRPEIGDMAPGVSSALLTTVIGLVVAIPAVGFNNYLSRLIDQTCSVMETFVDDFLADLQLEEHVEKTMA